MTGCMIIKQNRLTRFIFVLLLRRRLLLALRVVRVRLGFGLGPSLLLGTFPAFGFGNPGCRLFALVLPRLSARLPGLLVASRLPLVSVFFFLVSSSVLVTWSSPPKIPWEESTVYEVKARLKLGLKMVTIFCLTSLH